MTSPPHARAGVLFLVPGWARHRRDYADGCDPRMTSAITVGAAVSKPTDGSERAQGGLTHGWWGLTTPVRLTQRRPCWLADRRNP
jgi:hypothetical protein